MGQFHPADHTRGDANTIGGYMAVHQRPAAFEGPDGRAYSVDIVASPADEPGQFGAFFLFIRWSMGEQPALDGHIESDFLTYGFSEEDALAKLRVMPLSSVRSVLSTMLQAEVTQSTRPWWDAMKDS